MKLSDILLLLKGKRAAVGEIRNWKGGSYIKTPTGWKPHEKQYSKKYTERKNNAATKKDTDLRKRQSEVARLSGEIQGHKAAVEHHTAQNTKQDTRQAKHHSIRAQVKQRRLDKHKEILEQRHGVKDEAVQGKLSDRAQNTLDRSLEQYRNASPEKKKEFIKIVEDNLKQDEFGKDKIGFGLDEDFVSAGKEFLKIIKEEKPKKDEPVDFEKEHQKIQEAYAKDNARYNDIIKRIIQKSPKEHEKKFLAEAYDFVPDMNHIDRDYLLDIAKKYGVNTEVKETPSKRAQVKQRRLDKHKEILEQRHGVKDEVVKPVKKKQFNFSKPLSLNSIQNNTWGKQPENLSNDDLLKTYAYVKYANYAIKRNLINAPTGKTHILPQVGGQDNINAFENEIKKRGLENAFEIDIDLSQYRVKSQEAKANFEKWKADRQAKSDTPKEKPEPTKSDVIQSGNRGATIAGQHFSKREVDILNSLDEIIGRAKSPVVQDLLKKRQAAKPTPKTSNLEPHESKFMELVGKNRSQADKQAGYPEERRKVEAETGVKIPREKVNDILSGKSSQVSTPKSNDKGR